MGKSLVSLFTALLIGIGLLGLASGVVRYVTADELADSIAGAARLGGIKNPGLARESLRSNMKQEGLLFVAGGTGLAALGVFLTSRSRRARTRVLPTDNVGLLLQDLRSPRVEVRWRAVKGLGEHRTSARSALPALTELLGDPDALVRATASDALRSIDPEGSYRRHFPRDPVNGPIS
jgi:hypothetical protein